MQVYLCTYWQPHLCVCLPAYLPSYLPHLPAWSLYHIYPWVYTNASNSNLKSLGHFFVPSVYICNALVQTVRNPVSVICMIFTYCLILGYIESSFRITGPWLWAKETYLLELNLCWQLNILFLTFCNRKQCSNQQSLKHENSYLQLLLRNWKVWWFPPLDRAACFPRAASLFAPSTYPYE